MPLGTLGAPCHACWKNPSKMLSVEHCSIPSKKEGQCLISDNSLLFQTMNEPHCLTCLFESFILLIMANGKGRGVAKKLRLRARGKHKATVFTSAYKKSGFHRGCFREWLEMCQKVSFTDRMYFTKKYLAVDQHFSSKDKGVSKCECIKIFWISPHVRFSLLSSTGFLPTHFLFLILLLPAPSQLEANGS